MTQPEKRKRWKIPQIPKINSIDYGGKWIASSILIGAVIPGIVYMFFHSFLWGFTLIGGVLLVAFLVLFTIEMIQDGGSVPYYEKQLREKIPFDEENQYPVVYSSICTGEKMAGFKNRKDGHFTEVMMITSDYDLERFKKIYGLDDVKKEY